MEPTTDGDLVLRCLDCHSSFVWTSGEQIWYRERGWDTQPRRCARCRERRKAARLFDGSRPPHLRGLEIRRGL